MYSRLLSIFDDQHIRLNEPMKNHTTFKIGGPADVMILPGSVEELQQALGVCTEDNLGFFIMGQGSNLLVKDGGYRGVVIKIGAYLKNYKLENNEIYAEAGVRLSELARSAAACSLSGLEFAEGIPGSLGGAVVMNAGAYDGEMKNVVESVLAITPDGKLQTFFSHDLKMSYRYSVFQENGCIVVSAILRLFPTNQDVIRATMKKFARRRRERQPLEYPSAGSVFRRPEGIYVGPLIEKMGLKGFRIGNAEVSAKHAGFIVNKGNATAADVLEIIKVIQTKAARDYGVHLEPELVIIGEEPTS